GCPLHDRLIAITAEGAVIKAEGVLGGIEPGCCVRMGHVSDASAIATGATGPGAEEPAASAPPTRGAWRDRTGRDMFLAMASLLVPILLIGGLLRACGSAEPTVVDPGPAIDDARAAGLFPVVTPDGLGDGWRPVQAKFSRSDG